MALRVFSFYFFETEFHEQIFDVPLGPEQTENALHTINFMLVPLRICS